MKEIKGRKIRARFGKGLLHGEVVPCTRILYNLKGAFFLSPLLAKTVFEGPTSSLHPDSGQQVEAAMLFFLSAF